MKANEHDSWSDAVDYLYELGSILLEIQDQEKRKEPRCYWFYTKTYQ